MQTIFAQLDRQLTLEKELGEFKHLLEGGDIWRVLNQMVESDRKEILESGLGEVFEQFKDQSSENELWKILSKVREEEQNKLEETEKKLQTAQKDKEKIEQELQQYNEQIQQQVNQEIRNTAIVTVFLAQLKELSKDKFGDSILKEFLNSYGFKNKEDLRTQLSLDLNLLSENANLIEQAEQIIKTKDEKIASVIDNAQKLKYFLQSQPAKIVGLIGFFKKDTKNLVMLIICIILPFGIYFGIFNLLIPNWPKLLNLLTTLFTIPAILQGITVFKNLRKFQIKSAIFFKSAKENIETEKQNLEAKKQEIIDKKINEQRQQTQEQNEQLPNLVENLAAKEKEIQDLQAQIEIQKQRAGLTAQYTSLSEFISKRLEEDAYQKLLGIMHQIQDDLQDLSEHLTYKPGNQNKLKILQEYFPRGPARIVLYIDDLDRCPPNVVVQVLEAVQLLLNTEIFVVILAIDDRYISRALETSYKGVLKRSGTPSGVDYLEKIIQIPYRMRPIDKNNVEKYLKSQLELTSKK